VPLFRGRVYDPSTDFRLLSLCCLATLAPGSTVQPRRQVDLNSMIFTEGGHLNTNRKPTLPKGATKTSHKGYDIVKVPAPKKKEIVDGELVMIADMPEWTHQAFGTESTKLNPVQSKAYPIAFGTDEPVLLCAPTGAGKVRLVFPLAHCLVKMAYTCLLSTDQRRCPHHPPRH
jgi:hypothetical protein